MKSHTTGEGTTRASSPVDPECWTPPIQPTMCGSVDSGIANQERDPATTSQGTGTAQL